MPSPVTTFTDPGLCLSPAFPHSYCLLSKCHLKSFYPDLNPGTYCEALHPFLFSSTGHRQDPLKEFLGDDVSMDTGEAKALSEAPGAERVPDQQSVSLLTHPLTVL